MSSTTSTAASPTASSRQVQVEIPSSTVIAIGLGFLAFVCLLVTTTLGTRLYRVRRRMLADRAAGQPITFAQAWAREGGLFSFLTNIGNSGLGVGAGATLVGGRGTDRLWGASHTEKEVPIIWDVPIQEKAQEAADGDDSFDPFALSSTASPRYIDRATPATELPQPRFTLSILISLPAQPTRPKPVNPSASKPEGEDEEDEWAEIPEVLIGTTQICPMISNAPPEAAAGAEEKKTSRTTERQKLERAETKASALDGGAAVQELGYVEGSRPARWERYDVIKWRIEGMR
ncbi:uncharacterized protein MKK02DRAFT_39920 [Dioszegia hungarica]|uniref:Uncharacterized protein n=1 Tax=Dioszegia hungarica TaxID=4972 RepID=A0AA38LZ18_9TREE|nr:uncharacterized protein MKK02DRAFT_39920 [Dioszegia hungarica]KAI9639599.1 hypothetical protein MKK02DRAFT_39920 [Dioszegia hungarica]